MCAYNMCKYYYDNALSYISIYFSIICYPYTMAFTVGCVYLSYYIKLMLKNMLDKVHSFMGASHRNNV